MILSKKEILKRIKSGDIVIEPLEDDQIGPASIDLTLGDEIRVFENGKRIFHIRDSSAFEQYKKHTKIMKISEKSPYSLKSGEMIYGITREKITLPEDICGWLQGRSRFARLGLLIHITAGFIAPGISNKQVLELVNLSPYELVLYPRTKICQFIFEKMEGKAKYTGKAKNQIAP